MFYLLFILPVAFSLAALKTDYYPIKALVTFSCMAIIFLNLVLEGFPERSGTGLILAAFALSIGGDYFLSSRGDEQGRKKNYFLYGIGLFFLAHLAYLAYSSRMGALRILPLLFLLLPFCFYYFFRLASRLERGVMRIAVYLYLLISCFSMAWVLDVSGSFLVKASLIAGIGLILFSDTCISETNFCGRKAWGKLILPSYYAAHMLLTLGTIL